MAHNHKKSGPSRPQGALDAGQISRAVAALKLNPDPRLRQAGLVIARHSIESNNFSDACRILDVLKHQPESANLARGYLAVIDWIQGRTRQGLESFEQATGNRSETDEYLDRNAARAFFLSGHVASAQRCAERLLTRTDKVDYKSARELGKLAEQTGLADLAYRFYSGLQATSDHFDPEVALFLAKNAPLDLDAEVAMPAPDCWQGLRARNGRTGDETLDVVIPVYRDRRVTLHCIHSVLASSCRTAFELVVIDDCSPDPDLKSDLRRLAEMGLISLHVNEINQGFVRSVNRGMALHATRDVVLLNSDTEVNGDWLDRLTKAAYSTADTGTVTPLSNNATICSYPGMGENNMCLEISAAKLDLLATATNTGQRVEIPTAVGFCMYIRRESLNETGGFDAEAFGQGYGEENDFCMRAARLGWRHFLATDVYVRHFGSVSFGASRSERVSHAMAVLNQRYPEYNSLIQRHIAADPALPFRMSLDLARIRHATGNKPALLFVAHALGGGTEKHIQEMVGLAEEAGVACFLLRPNYPHDGRLHVAASGVPFTCNLPLFEASTEEGLSQLLPLLKALHIGRIHIHNLVGYPIAAIRGLPDLAQALGCEYDFTAHDYSPICPRITLIDSSGKYCGGAPLNVCVSCLADEAELVTTPGSWWRAFRHVLQHAAQVFVPSHDMGSRLSTHISGLRIVSRPHAFNPGKDAGHLAEISPHTGTVAIIGAIHRAKGSHVVLECARHALTASPGLRFVIIGTMDVAREEIPANVEVTGRYREEEVDDLIRRHRCAIAFFPAIWPETYSYTLSIAFRHHLCPIAFDIGAIAERIRDAGFGRVLPLSASSNPREIVAALEMALKQPGTDFDPQRLALFYRFEEYYGLAPEGLREPDSIMPRLPANDIVALRQRYCLAGAQPHAGVEVPGREISSAEAKFEAELLAEYKKFHPANPDSFMSAVEIARCLRHLDTMTPHPGIRVVVMPARGGNLPLTLRSIAIQYLRVKASVIAAGEIGGDLPAGLDLHLLDGDPLAAFNTVAHQAGEDWIIPIVAGDCLLPHASLLFACHVGGRPQWDLAYSDELRRMPGYAHFSQPVFKPDINPGLLYSRSYVGALLGIRRETLLQLGGLRPDLAEAHEYDLALRILAHRGMGSLGHIPDLLAWKNVAASAPTEQALCLEQGALAEYFRGRGIAAGIGPGLLPGTHRVEFRHMDRPLVSIIIPTRNHIADLQRCVESILEKTTYGNFELLIVDNDSSEESARVFLDGLKQIAPERIRVFDFTAPFNYSAINNFAAREARGDYLLLLNNDTAVLHEDWLDRMMDEAQLEGVGGVGCRLVFPDGRLQHAGIVLGLNGLVDFPWRGETLDKPGHLDQLQCVRDASAITGACMLVRRSVYEAARGMDEAELPVSFGDFDLCLKIGKLGFRIVWTPHATLMHEAAKTLKDVLADPQQAARAAQGFEREKQVFLHRWHAEIARDPAYNPNLSLGSLRFEAEKNPDLVPTRDPLRDARKIFALPADLDGSGHYRVIQPFGQASRLGLAGGRQGKGYPVPVALEKLEIDTVYSQRQVDDGQLAALGNYKSLLSCKVVMDFDDLLTHVSEHNFHRQHVWKDIEQRVGRLCALSDRITVSTRPLAHQMQRYHADIRVIPNAIDRTLWSGLEPRRRRSERPRVGWVGGISHAGDLAVIREVVSQLGDEVEWVFMGMHLKDMKPYLTEFHPGVPFRQYPAKMASLNLDLALAPLESNLFNECKSNLRLLEYGALGIPVIATDITPYQCGLPVSLVKNQPRDWIKAIRAHIHDLDETARRGDSLKQAVLSDWMLDSRLEEWVKAWSDW